MVIECGVDYALIHDSDDPVSPGILDSNVHCTFDVGITGLRFVSMEEK